MSLAEDDAAALRAADRERRRREDELLLLLLLLIGEAERDARVAASHGLPVGDLIRRVLVGDAGTGRRGAVRTIARAMAQAHRDGFRRAGLMAGTREIQRADAGTLDELIATYTQHARTMAQAMADTLATAAAQAVAVAEVTEDGQRFAARMKRAVSDAFDKAGYSRANPYAVDIGVERAVVTAHNGGIIAGAGALGGVAVALRHCSVIDPATTDICRERDGLTLPVTHPYWLSNIPQLHTRCRSLIRVLTHGYDESDWLPMIPPAPGFGAAPPGLLESFMRA